MKQIWICVFLCLCLAAFPEAEKAPWQLIRHSLDLKKAEVEINQAIKEGYMPTGLLVKEGEAILILYVYNETRIFDKWLLKDFTDLTTFEKDCTALIKTGWVPVGISRSMNKLFMLFINADLTISAWKVVTGNPDKETMLKVMADYIKEGYICYDFSTSTEENKNWYLFLKTPKAAENKNEVVFLPNEPEVMQEEISKFLSGGWLPWGITYNNNQYSILLFQ